MGKRCVAVAVPFSPLRAGKKRPRRRPVERLDDRGHEGVRLDDESPRRLAVWMNTYAQRQGSFSEAQEEQLRQLRQSVKAVLAK